MTTLERLRETMGLGCTGADMARWEIRRADARFTWLLDRGRAVGLLDERDEVFELRCHGPDAACPPAEVPRHYHIVTYTGVRIITTWRLREKGLARRSSTTRTWVETGAACIESLQEWTDGSVSKSVIRLRIDPAWNAYVADVETSADVRRATTALEYCNVIPAAIGDSRAGKERHPFTFWKHPAGFRKMLKNPLWFTSVGAQDLEGEKHVEQGGFVGFGPDDVMNPVVEIVHSDPETGATTCDNLQDEHVMVRPPSGRHAMKTGWFHVEARYRLFSIPKPMAERIVSEAEFLKTGPMLAWKFQYPPIPELPRDLSRVELPGTAFTGASDWSRPVPWDAPFNGQLWTASPDPRAAIHYDRTVGRTKPGSIRLRAAGEPVAFSAGSGHTLHLEPGQTYRGSMWVKTAGQARAWIEVAEVLHRCGDRPIHRSAEVGPSSGWTRVEVDVTGVEDEVPFAMVSLHADGNGDAWFTDPSFDPVG